MLLPGLGHAQEAPPPATATPGAPPKFGPEAKAEKKAQRLDRKERMAKLREELSLTPEQESKIREVRKARREKMRLARSANQGAKPSPEERRTRRLAARAEMKAAMKTILTPEQQTKWTAMKKDQRARNRSERRSLRTS